MPIMDGIEACEQICKIPELILFDLFLTARNESFTQISALDGEVMIL